MSQTTKIALLGALDRLAEGCHNLASVNIELENKDPAFVFSLEKIFETMRASQKEQTELKERTEVFSRTHAERPNTVLKKHRFFMNSFSAKEFMNQHFGNKIEEGLQMIEKERVRAKRNLMKTQLGCDAEDGVWDQSDLQTFEGCCFALAIHLFKNMNK